MKFEDRFGHNPPLSFIVHVEKRARQYGLDFPKPGDVIDRPVIFQFRRGLRPDLSPYYYYVCGTCGFAVGLQWLVQGSMDLLQHDCDVKCAHLLVSFETHPDGEHLVKWVPAFNQKGSCRLCGKPEHLSCRKDDCDISCSEDVASICLGRPSDKDPVVQKPDAAGGLRA